jgi:hypothetical protein
MACASIGTLLITTLLRKYIIQLNTVFLGKEVTFYITENNNLFFTIHDADITQYES